jgi:LysW-gamma-L-lysine carboxypeptidase
VTGETRRAPEPSDDAAIAFLREIVAIPSPSTQEQAVAERSVAAMRALGYEAEVDAAGNAVGRIGVGNTELLLLGHIDTAPGSPPVRVEGGCLYGRGAVDAKGPFATFVMAAARAAAFGLLRHLRVTVVGAVEEEAATSKGARHVAATYAQPAMTVIGEPSGWDRITVGYKGRLLIDYALERPVGHSAGRARGVCEDAVEYWLAVRGWCDAYNGDRQGLFATADPSLRALRSESDGLSERVAMQVALRLPVGFDVEALEGALRGWGGEARVTTRGYERAIRADKRTPLTSAFLAAIRAEGGQPSFVTKTGTSDMNVLGHHWSCPILAYGPGDSSLDHTPHEHIVLEEYLAAIRVLTGALKRLDARG